MRIQPKHSMKIVYIAGAVLVVIVGGFLILRMLTQQDVGLDNTDTTPSLDSRATDEQIDAGKAIKEQTTAQPGNKNSSGSDSSPDLPVGEDGKQIVTLSVTAKNQTDTALQIRVLISDIAQSGSCALEVNDDTGTIFSQSAGVQNLASTSTCAGFNIPLSSLPKGDLTINIEYNSETTRGSVTDTVNVR